ncbi:unnamed protein product [Brassica napus]|uniref:(rape) hypothetical protein n=1 Tax=Brassica napus TaxID=3708 RepID=A0A816I3X9_BRANA|nr:unnamed protein product [Brassica napus]
MIMACFVSASVNNSKRSSSFLASAFTSCIFYQVAIFEGKCECGKEDLKHLTSISGGHKLSTISDITGTSQSRCVQNQLIDLFTMKLQRWSCSRGHVGRLAKTPDSRSPPAVSDDASSSRMV